MTVVSEPVFFASEQLTLQNVCEALLPTLQPEPGDNPPLFTLNATKLGVAIAMEQAIASLDKVQQAQLRRLLRTLEKPLVIMLLIRVRRPFSELALAQQGQALLAMATSPIPLLRTGFQGLKRLATFLFYTLTDEQGTNPTWPSIAYTPVEYHPAPVPTPALITTITITKPTTYECDVCIIGSGAGGGVMAAELAAAGKRVMVLEAGGGKQAPDFVQRELNGMQDLYLDQGLTSTRDLGVAILAGATLGGGTTVNWQTALPLPDAIREEWAERSGCQHFVAESFTHSFEKVLARINAHPSPDAINANNVVLRKGCQALGYNYTELPRNDRGCDLSLCGSCVFGCPAQGKQSTPVTWLLDAQRNGDTTIITNCRAEQIRLEKGRVSGVDALATDPLTGRTYAVTIKATTVVVAAGAIHTPALLMRAGLKHPMLGRNLYLHPTTAVSGTYDELIAPWQGPAQSILCDEFAYRRGTYGYRLETAPGHPGLIALALPWFGASQHRRAMQNFSHTAVIIVLARDKLGGRVRLNSRGRPVVDYRPGLAERADLQHGIAQAVRLHLAAGASDVLTLHSRARKRNLTDRSPATVEALCREVGEAAIDRNWSTLFSAHQMGTCRMGNDPQTAVCDATGEVFGVHGLFIGDSSAFPASSGVNPMVTIMALAHHTAQAIKAPG